mmetsp:Transcript_2079/g.2825  ORF Transcript_2079/g.2825 Transcript_2079/m.2825 type:complete len:92 (+) Transcript_2079:79-354(+)
MHGHVMVTSFTYIMPNLNFPPSYRQSHLALSHTPQIHLPLIHIHTPKKYNLPKQPPFSSLLQSSYDLSNVSPNNSHNDSWLVPPPKFYQKH